MMTAAMAGAAGYYGAGMMGMDANTSMMIGGAAAMYYMYMQISYKWEVAIFGTAVRPHTEIYIFDLFWQVVDLFARSAEVESPDIEMTPEIEPRSSMNFDEI